jgi:DNA (cytosine-5)-methyltransferase 1
MDVNILDLFSGIGGFSKGLTQAGFNIKHHYFCEIDKHAIAVYQHHFKDSIYAGSVTDVFDIEHKPNIITFGSPCQDFSLAGKRAGMEGERSSLILEAIRLISTFRPDVFIWENVKGTFSSNDGADFWAIIQAFTNIGGYRLEWQLLNTSWFLPQNRERIYLIGHLATSKRSFRQVFPIEHNDGVIRSLNVIQLNQSKESGGKQPYQHNRVYADTGVLPALGLDSRNNIQIKSNTKQGYEEVLEGDSINFSVPTSKTRRGRVGKGKAQTLDTACNQGVVENSQIRRLTEIECERLQGFPDNWTKYGNYDGEVKEVSGTQRYRQCGNAVTVDVVEAIGRKLLNQ